MSECMDDCINEGLSVCLSVGPCSFQAEHEPRLREQQAIFQVPVQADQHAEGHRPVSAGARQRGLHLSQCHPSAGTHVAGMGLHMGLGYACCRCGSAHGLRVRMLQVWVCITPD